jgi:DNA primase
VENAVASSGTALTEEQIKLMRRFTENVTVLFDGDAAGIKAALRGIDLVLKGGLNVRVVLLPDSEDPDSYSRKLGSTAFKEYLKKNTKDFISFKIDLYVADAVGDRTTGRHDPIKKAEAIREIVTSISLIPDPIKRSVYIRETSDMLKISESVLLTELNKILIQERRKQQQEQVRNEIKEPPVDILPESESFSKINPAGMVQAQERETIRLLLNYAESHYEEQRLIDFLLTELEEVEFTNDVLREIYDTFRKGVEKGKIPDTLYFMENGSTEIKKTVADLTTSRYETSPHWSEKYHIYFPHEKEVIHDVAFSNVLRLKFRLIQRLMDENMVLLKQAKSEAETDKFITIHEQLKNAEKELAGILGIVIAR